MTSYFLRRFLLMIPTFIGITLAVFVITNFVPGGPIERLLMSGRMGGGGEVGASGGGGARVNITPEAYEELKRYYGFDKPIHIRYATWLWKVLHLDLGKIGRAH